MNHFLLFCFYSQVLILQPFNYCKNMVQQKQPIVFQPAIMYRGVAANSVNMGSCTMIQFAVGGKLKNLALNGESRNLTLAEEMGCGILAGSVSAIVGSPLELIMIQQQRKGESTMATIKSIASKPANIFRGFSGMMVRESLWTCGYLSIPPVVRRTLMEQYPEQFPTNNTARVPAALLGGLFACYLTHPADTIKTCKFLFSFVVRWKCRCPLSPSVVLVSLSVCDCIASMVGLIIYILQHFDRHARRH